MSISLERQSKGSSEAEVGYFDSGTIFTDQDITRFEVPMHNSSLITMQKCFHHLQHDVFDLVHVHRISSSIHILFEIGVEVFEDEVEFVFAMNDF